MSSAYIIEPVRTKFFTKGVIALTAVAAIGVLSYIYRLIFGLGAATNLTNQYPWGIWIAIDVASGVALAAGGFTTAAVADIFHRERYHALVRPALLTAMLGYTIVVVGLLADLGRYYNVWHPMIPTMWQGNSVLFEVGMCVMIYLTVLYIEFLPIVVERFKGRVNLPGILSRLNSLFESLLDIGDRYLTRFVSLFIIAGVVLSCLHQSSLGTLMLVAPTKMHPIWNSPISPILFLLSAICVGFPMVIFESILASRSFRRPPEMELLGPLSRYIPLLLGAYLAVRIGDLTIREVWPYVFENSLTSLAFFIEILIGVILPLLLLSQKRIRNSVHWLLTSVTLVILGIVINRINVFLVAYKPLYADSTYFPSIIEIAVTVGLISVLVLIYRFFVTTFPVLPKPTEHPGLVRSSAEPPVAHIKGE